MLNTDYHPVCHRPKQVVARDFGLAAAWPVGRNLPFSVCKLGFVAGLKALSAPASVGATKYQPVGLRVSVRQTIDSGRDPVSS